LDKDLFKIELPKYIGDKITFKVENSPIRHGKIIEFLTRSEGNAVIVTGFKVKCKNASIRNVLFDDIIEDNLLDVILKNSVEFPENKLIIIDFNMTIQKFELSVINNKEYTIVSKELYVVSCVEILQKLYAEYERILFNVDKFMFGDIIDLLNEHDLHFNIDTVSRELTRIIKLNKYSTALNVYVKGRQLNYNEDLVKHLIT